MGHFKLKHALAGVALVVLLIAGGWLWHVLTFDISGVVSNFGLGSPIRGYDKDGRLIYSGVLRSDDCVRSINACRSTVEAKGGGLCKVSPNSLKLRYESLTRAPYELTKIAVE